MSDCAHPFSWQRHPTREVRIGPVGVGGDHPIRIQTMLVSDTMNTAACVAEALPILEAGCEILRITAASLNDAKNLKNIVAELRRHGFDTPIVADIHFVPAAALEAAQWCDKVRINPGNYADRKKFDVREYTDDQYASELERLEKAFTPLVVRCQELGRALRIGTNHGSLSDRILNRYGDTPLGMVESALEFVRICRRHHYHALVLSMKASNPKVMIEAYRLLAARLDAEGPDWNYPLHLGVTEAGEGEDGRIKSAIGIGALLEDGLGDTIRVSLTEDSVHEIPVCQEMVAKYNALWERQRQGTLPPPPVITVTEKRNPFSYLRRSTPEYFVGELRLRLGGEHPPRVEFPLPLTVTVADVERVTIAEPDTFAEMLQFHVRNDAEAAQLAELKRALRARGIHTPIAVRLDSIEVSAAVADIADKLNVPYRGGEDVSRLFDDPRSSAAATGPAARTTIQFDVEGDSPEQFADNCHTLAGVANLFPQSQVILAVRRAEGLEVIGAYRILAATFDQHGLVLPILLRDRLGADSQGLPEGAAPSAPVGPTATTERRPPERYGARHPVSSPLITASVHLGSLLCDGIGDAVELRGEPDRRQSLKLAYNILQAAGGRTFKTDYVACPSCGRTLFDLQTVTARIKSRTAHLKGVKIAIMGCIVNGPGEMADADFGYVGTAPGRVSLWVGRQQVKHHIAEDQAVDELIALIKEHDKWIDPPASPVPAANRARDGMDVATGRRSDL